MKIGINAWVWVAPFRTDQHMALIPKAKSFGAEVFEIAFEDDTVLDTTVFKRALDGEGLGCSGVGLFGPVRDLSLDDQAQQAGLDYARRCIDQCAAIGASVFTGAVVGVGGTEFLTAESRQARLQRAAESLYQLGQYAQQAGVNMVVEILNRYESNFVTTAREARELMDQVSHPCVGIHLDTFHMGLEENHLGDAIRQAGDKLMHLHASESHRGTPGTGLVRWDQVAQGLRDINYGGYAVIESFNPQTWIGPLARFWRSFADSPDALARDGLAFLRKALRE